MYRKAVEILNEWKEQKNKKAMLVTGARQTGKTYLIREFGKKYKNYVEINFITQPGASSIFANALDADTIVMNMTAFLQKALAPGETLIFFDEIQECPEARTAIKFLVDDGRFDYIESGSLLGVRYKHVKSYPVGYETILHMYPMDFEEFCIANNVQQSVIDYLKDCYENSTPVSEAVHKTMLDLFRYYIITGGMPAVVQAFAETRDVGRVIGIQNDILMLYRQDVSKYAEKDKAKITAVFDHIPDQLDDKNRRFQLSALGKNKRLREYENSFLWLSDAGVALPCYNLQEPKAPLRLNEQARLFKLFMSDSGLLCAAGLENTQFAILQGDLSVNMGSILENVFAAQLAANGFELRYLNKRNVGELDFVVQRKAEVIAIEIKSGNNYRRHQALTNALEIDEWKIKEGIVFCNGNIDSEGKVRYLPWYMIMFFRQDLLYNHFKVDLDLSTLEGF